MSVISSDISSQITLREFFASKAQEANITISFGSEATPIYNINVIWDGAEYYMSYTLSAEGTEVIVNKVDNMLPITITTNTEA